MTAITQNLSVTINDDDVKLLAEVAPGWKAPKYRALHLLHLLRAQGYEMESLKSSLQPLLERKATRKEFITACEKVRIEGADIAQIDKALRGLYSSTVKDWLAEVNALGADEDTPERNLADDMDYWEKYATKFGRKLLQVRAIFHKGQVLFRMKDVALITGHRDAQGVNANRFGVELQEKVKVNNSSKRIIQNHVFLVPKRELKSVDPRAADKTLCERKGDWYVTEKALTFMIQSAVFRTESARSFCEHLFDLLQTNKDTHRAKARSGRSPEEILEDDDNVLAGCRRVSKERGANPQAMVGQATVGLLGEKLSEFAERSGIKHPHRKNVILEMPDVGDDISSSVRLGNRLARNSHVSERGDVKVGRIYHTAGALTRKLDSMDGAAALALLSSLN